MRELSLNILDIAQNSVTAKADKIIITVLIDSVKDYMSIQIEDNGCGMDEDFLKSVSDPFTTTRTTRKVGLGIPLFKMSAQLANGEFLIKSKVGEGTKIEAQYQLSNVDRMPLGDIADTISMLIQGAPDINFIYKHVFNGEEFIFDTNDIKQILLDVPINSYEVLKYIKEYINENISHIQENNKY